MDGVRVLYLFLSPGFKGGLQPEIDTKVWFGHTFKVCHKTNKVIKEIEPAKLLGRLSATYCISTFILDCNLLFHLHAHMTCLEIHLSEHTREFVHVRGETN